MRGWCALFCKLAETDDDRDFAEIVQPDRLENRNGTDCRRDDSCRRLRRSAKLRCRCFRTSKEITCVAPRRHVQAYDKDFIYQLLRLVAIFRTREPVGTCIPTGKDGNTHGKCRSSAASAGTCSTTRFRALSCQATSTEQLRTNISGSSGRIRYASGWMK